VMVTDEQVKAVKAITASLEADLQKISE